MRTSNSISQALRDNSRSDIYAADRATAISLIDDCINISNGRCTLQDCYDSAADQGTRLSRTIIQLYWGRAHRAGRC